MSDSRRLNAVFDNALTVRKAGLRNWRVVRRRTDLVRGLDSLRVTATYLRKNAQWTSQVLIVYRPRQPDGLGNVVYVFAVSGPSRQYDSAVRYFDDVVRGFQLTPLPHGPCSNR